MAVDSSPQRGRGHRRLQAEPSLGWQDLYLEASEATRSCSNGHLESLTLAPLRSPVAEVGTQRPLPWGHSGAVVAQGKGCRQQQRLGEDPCPSGFRKGLRRAWLPLLHFIHSPTLKDVL